jgi:hypothetical protein
MELLMLMFDRMIGKAAIDVVAIYTNTHGTQRLKVLSIPFFNFNPDLQILGLSPIEFLLIIYVVFVYPII